MCYSFAPALVERAIPDAWRYASPDAALAARLTGAAASLRAHVPGPLLDSFGALACALWEAVRGAGSRDGRSPPPGLPCRVRLTTSSRRG